MNEEMLTVAEAMNRLRCSKSTLYALHRAGKIEMIKFMRHTRVTQQSVDKLLKESARPAGRGRAA